MAGKQWFPLESNPEVMNTYVEKMGLDVSKYSFHDVFSTEDWALEMVPRPVVGVVMLYPITPASEKNAEEEHKKIDSDGQVVSSNTYFMKQTVGNACGTVGILHAIGNARNILSIAKDSYLEKFFSNTETLEADAIADYLESDDEIEAVHEAAATEGQSEQPEEVNTHFVSFRYDHVVMFMSSSFSLYSCFFHFFLSNSVVDGHLYQFGMSPLLAQSLSTYHVTSCIICFVLQMVDDHIQSITGYLLRTLCWRTPVVW